MPLTRIQSPAISANAVTSAKIAEGAVVVADIADGSITTSKLANANVTSTKIVTVANTQITGNIIASQITSVANSQITGNIISSQIQPTGVTSGTYGNAIFIPSLVVDSGGRITNASNVSVDFVRPGNATVFTTSQTFRSANAIRSEAASTQDAIVIAGRAGGSGSYAITLTPASLSASRTLTLPEPGEDVTIGYLNIPQNIQTGSYTLQATDAGKHIYRGSGSAATWTIPANSSVAYPIGTALTFVNLSATSANIAITSDIMYLSSAGTTGTRTLAQYGSATALKITSNTWIISGSGLT